MRTMLTIAALSLALTASALTPAVAQEAERSAAISSCTVPPVDSAACNAAVELYIAVLASLPATDADNALAELVIVLANAGTPETQGAIGAAIQIAAAAITDQTRATAAADIGANVAAGIAIDPVLTQAVVSPN